jgi:hypothetical protein
MKLSTHAIAQGLALVLQYANQASNVVPVKAQPYVALVIGLCQAGLAFVAHFSPAPSSNGVK